MNARYDKEEDMNVLSGMDGKQALDSFVADTIPVPIFIRTAFRAEIQRPSDF